MGDGIESFPHVDLDGERRRKVPIQRIIKIDPKLDEISFENCAANFHETVFFFLDQFHSIG